MEKGIEFEQMVGELYERMGFSVERNKLVEGVSKAIHEIDVYAEKKGGLGRQTVFVECKYRNDGSINKGDLANFLLALDDVRMREGYVVTNTSFSDDARIIAENYNIRLIDGGELTKLFREYGMEDRLNALKDESNDPFVYLARSAISFLDEAGVLKRIFGH